MNALRSLYYKAVAVADARWADLDSVEVVPPGQPVERVGYLARPFLRRATDRDSLEPTPRPLPKGSSMCATDQQLARRVLEARGFASSLSDGPQTAWSAIEKEQADKLSFQRGGAPMWWVAEGGYVAADAPSMLPAFQALLGTLGPELPTPPPTYKMGTNHSFPDYGVGHTSYAMHAMWARACGPSAHSLEQLGHELAAVLGQGDTPLSAALFNRSGPLRKPVFGYSPGAQGAVRDCQLTGLCPRRRPVNGIPSAINMAQLDAVTRFTTRAYHWPLRRHMGPEDVSLKLRRAYVPGWRVMSDDISGFDTHVSKVHQDEMTAMLYAPFMGSDVAGMKAWSRQLPLLSPPITQSAQAWLYRKHGTTASGDLTTALDGSFINEARILSCVAAAAGRSVKQVFSAIGSRWFYLLQGDDTVLMWEPGFIDEEKYVDESTRLGYPCKLQEGCVFLMQLHDPTTGRFCPLASRVLQQTWWNEYGGVSVAMELFAFIARTPRNFWLVNPWARTVARLLSGAEPFARFGVTPETAADALRNPEFVANVAADMRADSKLADHIKWSTNLDDWLPEQLSLLASQLLSSRQRELPTISPSAARTAALKLAEYLAADEKPETLRLGSTEADNYVNAITRSQA